MNYILIHHKNTDLLQSMLIKKSESLEITRGDLDLTVLALKCELQTGQTICLSKR